MVHGVVEHCTMAEDLNSEESSGSLNNDKVRKIYKTWCLKIYPKSNKCTFDSKK